MLFRHWYKDINNTYLSKCLNFLQEVGWVGVDIFFVISGFLISGLIIKEVEKTNSFNVKRFLIRRGFKIYPSFYILILFTLIIYFLKREDFNFSNLLAELFYYQNYHEGLYNHTWSLAVEEHFYLILCVLTLALIGIKPSVVFFNNRVLIVSLLFILLILITRVLVQYNITVLNSKFMYFTHNRIDSMFMGVVLFLILKGNISKPNNFQLLYLLSSFVFIILLFLSYYFINNQNIFYSIGFTVLNIFSALLIALLIKAYPKYSLTNFIGSIGVYSYSIYLWHMPVKFYIVTLYWKMFGHNFYMETLVYLMFSILIGVFSFKIIESPMLKYRDKYFP